MPARTLIEMLHIVVGLLAATLIATLSAWSYPPAREDIWLVTGAAMAAVVAMGVGPIRRAWLQDRESHG
ncbi:hypothetical protein [Sphingosinithalassobacter sp. LHW66-3]|uniref:hypothetical protein n=1 Tax=Sphingosinithalassobacter sp. LHW66-3 TaxID=3424718 RepID=UPI003D6A40CB